MDREKMFSIVGLVLVVGAVVSYSIFDLGKSSKALTAKAPTESVATVNGVDIPQDQYDAQLANALSVLKNQGVDVTSPEKIQEVKVQVLNDFINNELVAQAVIKAGIKPTAEDVEKQFQIIQTQAGGVDGLKAELVKANITAAQLREKIAKQLAVQAYLLQNVSGINSVTVSDAEISAFYKEYSAGKTGVPALKDLKEQIKQQIITNKQQALVSTFVATLRASAKIVTNLK